MVIAGGNKTKKPIKGKTAKIKAFGGRKKDRVILEGLNLITKHKKQTSPQDVGGKISIEASMHISNVMFYVEKIKKPVRLKTQFLDDGKKVREEHYTKEVVPKLIEKFKYKNIMEVPKLKKIVLNTGLGEAVQNSKVIEFAVYALTQISGQKPMVTKAKKSIATFKLREGMPIGCMVTMR
ncbi:UNVERIFIED_CONTAM: hypothetical protein GTU68_059461, partial [Idotea baltica]|nr:hypothetical protein [Idotea baltica]